MPDDTAVTDNRVRFLEQMVSLEYVVRTSPVHRRFDEQMRAGRITGHRCPACGRVYVPPKGYCPLCVVTTGERDEVDVADRATVTSFTVLTPIQYRGQLERSPYALANLLLDGADSTVGQQRILDVALDAVHMGMRVQAQWLPPEERAGDGGPGARWGLGNAIRGWTPTGEADAQRETYQAHVL